MRRTHAALLSCAAAFAIASPAARAQLFKCVGADGKTSYQSEACPTTAKEQRLKQDSRADPGDDIPEGIKPGWDQRELIFMADICTKSILGPAQKEFDAASQPFPDKQLTPAVEKHCNCMARRASTTWTFIQYSKDPVGVGTQLSNEALKGGPCRPEGLHAELLRKAGKMK
jgi:hypothetical protein